MRVEKLGDGEPQYSVVGGMHGDEPCGKKAIEKFLGEDWKVEKAVQFVIANERALEEGERHTDVDLNRSFPGNPDSENYEERLARKLMKRLEGTRVLDIHSTMSSEQPFANHSQVTDNIIEMIQSLGVENATYFPVSVGALNENVEGITLEAGKQGTEQAAENAYRLMVNFLAAEGVIDTEYEENQPEFFKRIGTVKGDWKFEAENFELVEEGEVYASNGNEKLRAEKNFYPVLMSTDGYENMLGHKAMKIDRNQS